MKRKRILSLLLAVCMVLSLSPAVSRPVRAAVNDDPEYIRAGTPEVAIFNAYTGASDEFFKKQMANHFYNAVATGAFKKTDNASSLLNYEVKVSDNATYVWSGFCDSNLAYLSDKYQELQAGYSVTRTSNSHTHRWKLIYSASLTSYMNTDLYLNDAARNQYWDLAYYRSFSNSGSTLRQGNTKGKEKFHSLGYTINGLNSRYYTINGVEQKDIRKDMYISFVNSTLMYDGQKKTCTCGGSATGAVVSFYDGIAPTIRSVEIKNGNAPCTNFKAGDTVTVVLNCSEAIRFADDSAVGKGNVYIGLMVEGATDRLPAYLTSLNGETLTFTYDVPATDKKLYTITGIDLTSAPPKTINENATALVHTGADITLKQIYMLDGVTSTYTANNPISGGSELGYSKTTCFITDMAGNALVNEVPATSFYIDCEQPYIAVAGLSANTNNGDIKAILGKTDSDPSEDNSDSYLGVGDSFSLTLYMNEVVTGSGATVTTNVKKSDDSYLTLGVISSGTTAANGIGSQYGKGASAGQISVLYTDAVTIADGMTVDGDEGIKITGVTFGGVKDASGNIAAGAARSPDKKYYIDTLGPAADSAAAVQLGANQPFYLPFTVTDGGSGVTGLPAFLILKNGTQTSGFRYAVTASTDTPTVWSDGAMGTSIPFSQTGGQQYLHVKPNDKSYAVFGTASVVFTLQDYAGNAVSREVPLSGVILDTGVPEASAEGSTHSFDNGTMQGTLTVNIHAADPGGLAAVQYQWSVYTISSDTELTGSWINAVGSLDGNPASADMTADAVVASGDIFRKLLWARVTDVAGNTDVTNLGEFVYNLQGIRYELDYSRSVRAAADVKVSALDVGGKLVFDVRKAGSDIHYVTTAESAANVNIFSGTWYTAAFSDDNGYSFTGLEPAGDFLSGYTGNLYVTVYSGNGETITIAADTITATANAGTERLTLRVSPSDNQIGDVFSGTALLTADAATLSALSSYTSATPWSYGSGSGVSSTLEGVQLSINLGDDINGWDYADIDWSNSFIALFRGGFTVPTDLDDLEAGKICGIGSGPSQTVTLPAGDYAGGYYHLVLVLVRKVADNFSVPAFYTAVLQQNGESAKIYIDDTAPGSLSLGLMTREQTGITGWYEEVPYDPDAVIYIPTEGFDVMLSVEAMGADGLPADFAGSVYNFGAMDVIAWNTASPEEKISLSRRHLFRDTDGQIKEDQQWASYPTNGKRMLQFGETTADSGGFPSGILGVTTDQNNIIALQVRYANGKASAVTYLTVHPVSLSLTGTITTSPTVEESVYGPFNQYTTSGLITVDPGTAIVTFTPDSAANTAGLTLYCQEGFVDIDGKYITPDGFEEQAHRMTLQSDGTYTCQIPTADAEAYDSAAVAYAADSANNPHPGRYNGILEPLDNPDNVAPVGHRNAIRDGGQPVGYYVVYATDQYGNKSFVGITKNAVIADGSAPIIDGAAITAADGAYTADFTIYDDSLYAFGRDQDWNDTAIPRPMTLILSYDKAYSAAIGASGESLTLTLDASGGVYRWTADSANKLGIHEVEAVLTRSGEYTEATTYYKGARDVYLTVTVKGIVSPAITGAANMTLNITAVDAHGNQSETTGVKASVTGIAPVVTAMEFKPIQMTPGISDLALFVTFNQPVQPAESWINRNISGFALQWQDSFPITNDGVWDITFTDVFGTVYTLSVDTADYKGSADSVFGVYGFDLDFSTLDYVAATEGVTITASYTGTDGDSLQIMKGSETLTPNEGDRLTGRTATASASGDYTVYLYGAGGWTEKLNINLNNIVSGGPEETLYFFIDEFKEQYEAGADDQFRGKTAGSVTVSYRTGRETSPVGDTTLTFRYGDSDSFSFQYYDVPTDFTYTISGKLSDYGITLAPPEKPYEDKEAPTIDLVTVWTQKGSGFVQSQAFPGSAAEAAIKSAIEDSGIAQSYDFVVNASDYSRWKVVVRSSVPSSMSYASAVSDTIPGVEVQGNNILVTKEVAGDFYIVVVDNAAKDSAASADNFTCILIPSDSYQFDTTPPEIVTTTVSNGLYSKTVYIRVTDQDDAGNDTGSSVTVTGPGVEEETNTIDGVTYTHRLEFKDNDTVVEVTATDAAGNFAVADIQVTGIDVEAPILAVTWSPCFKDPDTGKLDQNNPTAGPVNTDVVAHITSNKEILEATAVWKAGDGPEENYDFAAGAGWGRIEFTSQLVSVFFTDPADDLTVKVTVTAPNGKSTSTVFTLNRGVIDKVKPSVTAHERQRDIRSGFSVPFGETHILSFSEDVYCMNYGTAGEVYNEDNPFALTMTENGSELLQFADRAGNLTTLTLTTAGIDSEAPILRIEVPDSADATSAAVTVAVTANEPCTLQCAAPGVTCSALTEGTDEEGSPVWTGTVSVEKNGTFRLTAADGAGNTASAVFTVNNIDRTLPNIHFASSTVSLRQDSEAEALTALLEEGVTLWDNVEVLEDTLRYDAGQVLLDTPGIYTVIYSVEDSAGNIGQAERYVKVIDKNLPVLILDGELTEPNGTISLHTGDHILTVSGLKAPDEPYTLKLVKGIRSVGQMKRVSDSLTLGEDGSFTIASSGYYTLYMTTQSRQIYRTLLYVEN